MKTANWDALAQTADDFSNLLSAIAKDLDTGIADQVVRKTFLDLHSRIVALTPKETGRAMSNWAPTIGAPFTGTVEPGHEFTEPEVKLGDLMWIANNLEYIEALEGGHSTQRPAGFVGLSLAEFNTRFAKYAAAQGLSTT